MLKALTCCLPAFAGLLLLTCQAKKTATTEQAAPTISSVTRCYALTMNGDTVRLTVRQTGNDVTGKLLYQLSGKDRNTGTIRGTMHGDTLRADYMFHAEGVESIREVAFLAQKGGFLEGFGPVEEKNGKMRFTPNTAVTFSGNRILKQADCQE
ncbi:hypothetical protein J2I47_03960 [Fibrella sp. HMF5335]|uniref:Uncharacterized protein n=1 Tax=Fibrella rubiginis TaxID=2817060 RepID=A0A939K411_9BACT|nr:hypothetical protein [Fibrella rubiginis]MBO0935696.1 hypothetical protein [Fibrella rubiginis]